MFDSLQEVSGSLAREETGSLLQNKEEKQEEEKKEELNNPKGITARINSISGFHHNQQDDEHSCSKYF